MTEETKDASPSPMLRPPSLDEVSREWLNSRLEEIEEHTGKDTLAMLGRLEPGFEIHVRLALECLEERRKPTLFVILDTPGGLVEVVQRTVNTLRHFYETVHFLVPVEAMSAGTVLVMSGDAIYMDYASCLGPIDPQIQRDGRVVPALSYLHQYQALIKKNEEGRLSMAELTLLNKLDLAELHQIELAANLSKSLIEEWLPRYKFKDWNASDDEKRTKASVIADTLNNHQKWYTHGRGIHKNVLEKNLGLKIDDYSEDTILKDLVWRYFWFAREYTHRAGFLSFVHSRGFI